MMLGILAAAVMAGSFFLPWIEVFGNDIGPTMLIDNPNLPVSDLPWRAWVFLASFVLAAIAALLALARRPAGAVMLVAGAIPYALILEQGMGVRNRVNDLGLPMPTSATPGEAFDTLMQFLAIGLPAYFISAAFLMVIGLVRLVRGA